MLHHVCRRYLGGGIITNDYVTVSLDLSINSEANGTPHTKAIDMPSTVADTKIRNLCIFQFGGTDENAPLVGDVHYLRDDVAVDSEEYMDLSKVRLVDSQGSDHTIVILANTFSKISSIRTLGQLKELWRSVASYADVFSYVGDASQFPNGNTFYQRMNAVAVTQISNGTQVKAVLRRSMARINVEINNDGKDNLRISQVHLRNVSKKDYYLTDYSYIDGSGTGKIFKTDFQDAASPMLLMDYDPEPWSGASPDGTGKATYTWYVPANMRGSSSNNIPSEKNKQPNATGATFIQIIATYGADKPIVYTFYLGENLTNNYDIRPNTSYTYRFNFSGKGNASTDSRIEDLGGIDFEVDANCYMLIPPVAGTRTYSFNVVHRPNIFWGNQMKDIYGMNEKYPNNYIGNTEEWYAKILWSDFEMSQEQANAFLNKKTGNGGGSYMDSKQRVNITLNSGIPEGNVVIGIYTDNEENILWSWHLWITTYEPHEIEGHLPVEETYVYYVKGGEVHRYKGKMWDTGGLYENGYAMDRNLGALDQKYHGTERGGGFYYQFGRKDPFPGGHALWIYDKDNIPTSLPAKNSVTKVYYASTGESSNVPYSVLHPMTFLYSSHRWTHYDIFNPGSSSKQILWQDPNWDMNESNTEKDKAIFDPCPYGWRLPYNGWLSDFRGDGSSSSTTNTNVNFQWNVESENGYNRGSGRTYYPKGYLNDKNNASPQTAFFPYSGRRENISGNLGYYGDFGYCWTNSPAGLNDGCWLYMSRSDTSNSTSTRAHGLPVRCVKE